MQSVHIEMLCDTVCGIYGWRDPTIQPQPLRYPGNTDSLLGDRGRVTSGTSFAHRPIHDARIQSVRRTRERTEANGNTEDVEREASHPRASTLRHAFDIWDVKTCCCLTGSMVAKLLTPRDRGARSFTIMQGRGRLVNKKKDLCTVHWAQSLKAVRLRSGRRWIVVWLNFFFLV